MSVITGSVALTGASVAATAFIKSPAQAAADTRPPAASVLTTAVQKRVLSETVVTRGKVVASQEVGVSGAGAGEKDARRAVVTKVEVKEGAALHMGQLLLEVSGRPMFVLKGDIPAYRDLKPGSTGEDVLQLQRALAELGYPSGADHAGTFGSGTAHAVSLFYRAHNVTPVMEQSAPRTAPGAGSPQLGTETAETASDTRIPASHVTVPLSEITYVRAEPAFVDQVAAHVGDEADGDLMSLSAGTLIVNGFISPDLKGLVKPGQDVSLASEVTGVHATGSVEWVADKPAKPQKDSEQPGGEAYAIRIKPSGKLSPDLAGEDVRLTITAASSQQAVLAVPSSAISAGEDGQTTVTVRRGQQDRRVVVETGMTADGYVQVTPRTRTALTVGDRVVVGVDAPQTPGDE
ncbi:peptidoglycan-binding protein [Streptomyces sp. SID2999]|uniref:peptidoglycan-binding domain-containing protein n=1 Tax=Streptomyces sp. SID2999 TaxID=2690258 RepID=UPI0013683302|nr:peptidoglycan-binding domain-containing protein [Streptomyces sp. SID2999]MYZ10897.1 peptidoglycan-binding protein [Streptomyces sp. SID2999]